MEMLELVLQSSNGVIRNSHKGAHYPSHCFHSLTAYKKQWVLISYYHYKNTTDFIDLYCLFFFSLCSNNTSLVAEKTFLLWFFFPLILPCIAKEDKINMEFGMNNYLLYSNSSRKKLAFVHQCMRYRHSSVHYTVDLLAIHN